MPETFTIIIMKRHTKRVAELKYSSGRKLYIPLRALDEFMEVNEFVWTRNQSWGDREDNQANWKDRPQLRLMEEPPQQEAPEMPITDIA